MTPSEAAPTAQQVYNRPMGEMRISRGYWSKFNSLLVERNTRLGKWNCFLPSKSERVFITTYVKKKEQGIANNCWFGELCLNLYRSVHKEVKKELAC